MSETGLSEGYSTGEYPYQICHLVNANLGIKDVENGFEVGD